MITYEDLRYCSRLAREAKAMEAQVAALRCRAEFGGLKSEMVNGVGVLLTDGTGEGAAAMVDVMAKTRRKALEHMQKVLEVEEAIGGLANPACRETLRLRYVEGLGWQSIAERMHYGERQCRRFHQQGLEELGLLEGWKGASQRRHVQQCPPQMC